MRGVNVGGKNLLPMDALARLFADAGCTAVRTYIQSGNVLFRATPARANRLPGIVAKGIADSFGYQVPVVLRSAAELGEIVRHNPFLAAGAPESWLHVLFLPDPPPDARVATLDPHRSPPDAFAVRGREIYLKCPEGVGKTRLTNAWFDSSLATTCTGRNWRTVTKLSELATLLT